MCSLPHSELDLVKGGTLRLVAPAVRAARFKGITRNDAASHTSKCISEENKEKVMPTVEEIKCDYG